MIKKKCFPIFITIILLILMIPAIVLANDSVAQPGALQYCEELLAFDYPETNIIKADFVPEGELVNAGQPVGEHCLVQGKMHERVSPVDGQTYAIGFEMRLPVDWAGRFLYQANGGLDGFVSPAVGVITGGQLQNGLQMGFAVLSSDAGHSSEQNPLFGLDPQARLDYGYQAVGKLTPMAKNLIKEAYGREPDRSYIAGTSNGGRHTMVAAARYADQYDGFLAGAPGFNLPKAAVAQLWGAQQWAKVATTLDDLETALPKAERQIIAQAILERCDGLDGLADGIVHDSKRCQETFDIERDVPTCDGERDGACLTEEQKLVIKKVFAGAKTSDGKEIYTSFPYDPGIVQDGWARWKFNSSVGPYDPVSVGFIFSTPPEDPSLLNDTLGFALNFDVDTKADIIYETNDLYTESGMEFMTPPNPTNLDAMRNAGGKMIVFHGASDGVFSSDDTARWYEELNANYGNRADEFVRYFEIPGMGHSRGGPATDQFDGLGALIEWVEYGKAPDRIIATARGEGNPGGVNEDVPVNWAPDRSRPLCPYPLVARYIGGNPEVADSFQCQPSTPMLSLVELATLPNNNAVNLTDITEHWANEDIMILVHNGILNGYPNNEFKPNQSITHAELMVIFSRILTDFPMNVDENDSNLHWAQHAIKGGLELGLLTEEELPNINNAVTRAELAVMLGRLVNIINLEELNLPANSTATQYIDEIPSWAEEAVANVSRLGILTGYSDQTFKANQKVTRAELATVIKRLLP